MITNILCFIAGGFIGLLTMALACVAGDAERCAECMRMREEIENERSNSETDK